MKIVVVASFAPSLVNFRGRLLEGMARQGHDVVACAPEKDARVAATLARWGVRYEVIPMARAGINPFVDMWTLLALAGLFRRARPDLVLAYTQKPIIYGGIAARLAAPRARRVLMCSGLGYACTGGDGGDRLRSLVRTIMAGLFRVATARAHRVLVFNRDDGVDMRDLGMLAPGQEIVQVPGSGVDLAHFSEQPLPEGPPTFLMIARLLRDKGVTDFVEAARLVRRRHPTARFQLLGPFDPNPSAISPAEMQAWVDEGTIEYLGSTEDVRPYLAGSTVFVLPSYYREGLPRSTLEAMATGRAVISTDSPGCREPIVHGDNGWLVPVRDPASLAVHMQRFIDSPDLAAQMGRRSRAIVVDRYSVDHVNALLFDLMGLTEDRLGAKAVPDRSPVAIAAAEPS
ncbi:glycosyltransferase family 4 protein [Sphingobium mellinum]|uniref:glycosyltransferase family 4 protein n=1 Tax=Sphingobium mellinum TaxID=1387166 RepID=UPI0030EBF4B3